MSKKKQQNFILGLIVLAFSAVAIFFSTDNSNFTIPFDVKNPPKEQVKGQTIISDEIIEEENEIVDENIEVEATPVIENQNLKTLHRVTKVVDGDTIDVIIDEKTYRLRLIGLNTPETVDPRTKVQCFGKEASNKAKELLADNFVSLESDPSQGERDKYGRLLRYVFLPDGTSYNKFMIENGFAYEYTYDSDYKYQKEYKDAQAYALMNSLGLWSSSTCSGNK